MTTRTERLKKLLELDNKQAMHMANDFYPGKDNHNARYIFLDGAMNQHTQTSALIAARDEKLAKINSDLSKAEALLRDAQVSLTLTWPLEAERIEKYFSEQAKGGECG